MKILFFLLLVGIARQTIAQQQVAPPSVFELALIKKETRHVKNPDWAIGDTNLKNKAYGCLQVRKPACDDVNRRYGTNYRPEDCLGNRELSLIICRLYLGMYATKERLGREPTAKDLARIWNGGPNGHLKESTIQYGQEFLEIYEHLLRVHKK